MWSVWKSPAGLKGRTLSVTFDIETGKVAEDRTTWPPNSFWLNTGKRMRRRIQLSLTPK